jgi:GT2 family glycosyltransferase
MVKKKYKSFLLIENSKNVGFASANNQALKIAKGEFILLLNSDTLLRGAVVANSVKYLEDHPQVGAMGCRVLNTDGSMQATCSNYPSKLNLLLLTSGLWKIPWPRFFDRYQMRRWNRLTERDVEVISGCYLLLRKTILEQVGLLDENFFFFGEETDWCLRMRKHGWTLRFAPVGEIIHHGGGTVRRLSHQRDLMLSSAMVKLHLKHGGMTSAVIVWLIVNGFNFSRAVFWTLCSVAARRPSVRERRQHFISLVRDGFKIWPSDKTWVFKND